MPRSRGRKKRKGSSSGQQTRVVKLNPQVMDALETQRGAFRKKFGRDMGPGDPLYFDPDEDTPQPFPDDKMRVQILEAMNKAGVPPQIAYAYAKTGLLLMEEHQGNYPAEAIAEWTAAIEEYFRLQDEGEEH
jgi:integrase